MIYTIVNRLGEINWASLRPGDEVRVPWRAEPYRERIVVSCRGTEPAWIKVKGIPGPAGQLPVIDAENAVTDPQFLLGSPSLELSGLITVYGTKANNIHPGYLEFSGLEVRNAGVGSFTGADGTVKTWNAAANGFYVGDTDHIRIRGCLIHSNGQGIFTFDSKPCADVLIEGNRIWDNGVAGSDRQHNTYIQAARTTYRNNWYGLTKAGSNGGGLKDRSADVLIEGNTIIGGARMIDISSWQNEVATRKATPNATRTIIRNNLLIPPISTRPVYVEGRTLEDGTSDLIEFSNNTLVARIDQAVAHHIPLFVVEYNEAARITLIKNLFDVSSATPGAKPTEFRMWSAKGHADVGVNWSRNAVSKFASGYPGNVNPNVVGWENITIGGVDPGYVNEAAGDYRLTPGAAATGFGADLTAPAPAPNPDPDPVPDPDPIPDPDPTPDPDPLPTPEYQLVSETVQAVGLARVTIRIEERV